MLYLVNFLGCHKKVVCPLELEAQKIHDCTNDCILYRGEEYKNLDAYPIYKACRYKIPHDDPDDIERVHTKKKLLAKVMWYSLRDKKKQVNNWCEYDICEFMHNLSKCGRITTEDLDYIFLIILTR